MARSTATSRRRRTNAVAAALASAITAMNAKKAARTIGSRSSCSRLRIDVGAAGPSTSRVDASDARCGGDIGARVHAHVRGAARLVTERP